MRDRTLAELRARQSREFLDRNAPTIRREFWRMKAENALAAHRREQENAE